MASIRNKRDDPEPEVVEELPSLKTPLLSAAATTGVSHDVTGNDQFVPSLMPDAALTGLVDQPLASLSRNERKRKLTKERAKERSHESRIDNPKIKDHAIKKYMDSATPLFKDAHTEKATVASTGYVGLGGGKKKVEKDKAHRKNTKEEGKGKVIMPDVDGVADYSKAEAMLQELRGKGYDLLKCNGL